MPATKRKPTHEELAKLHKVSRVTISRYAQQGVDIYDRKAVETHRLRSNVEHDLKLAELEKKHLEIEKLELSISVTNANHYPKPVVEEGLGNVAAVLGMLLADLISSFPGTVPGMDAPAIEAECREFADKWTEKLHDAEDEVHRRAQEQIVKDMRGDMKKVAEANRKRGRS